MGEDLKQAALDLFENVDAVLQAITPRKRVDIDEIMVVYVDNVNGKLKHNSSCNLIDLWESLRGGSKPVGVIFLNWTDPENMKMKEFPGVSSEETALLAHAFAEVQDEYMENYGKED